MTNQQLKAHCEDVIANPQDHSEMVLAMAKALLPCLEAEPVVWIKPNSLGVPRMAEIDAVTIPYVPEYPVELFAAPPAPELEPIELPTPHREDYVGAKVMYADDVEAAIRDAGYEVKS